MRTIVAFLLLLGASQPLDAADVPTVASLALLRGESPSQFPKVNVQAYSTTTRRGGGLFVASGADSCRDDGGVNIQGHGGCYHRVPNEASYNIAWFGAQCGGVKISDGVATGTAQITSDSAKWGNVKAGWIAVVNNGASSKQQLVTTVAKAVSSSALTLAASVVTGTRLTIYVYPDDTAAFRATFTAAGTKAVTLPHSETCGFANPGVQRNIGVEGSLILNGGNLWLGQTGNATGSGVSLEFTGNHAEVLGPGVVDGLYQTNQGAFQSIEAALIWQHGAGISEGGAIMNGVVIQNTKGRCFETTRARNFKISNLTIRDCGDMQYIPPSGDEEQGRSMGGQFTDARGPLTVTNFTANNIAQSGLLLSNSTDPSFIANISNARFHNNAYYGLDIEEIKGAVQCTGCSFTVDPTFSHGRSFELGGVVLLNAPVLHLDKFSINGIDANAISLQESGPTHNSRDWSISNGECHGTAAVHNCAITFAFAATGAPQNYTVRNVTADYLSFLATASPVCSTRSPMKQLVTLDHVHLTGKAGGSFDSAFTTQDLNGHLLYVHANDSELGRGSIIFPRPSGTGDKAIVFDMERTSFNRAPSITGGTPIYLTKSPRTSFTCP